ncbi:MAG TPA: efflux RND transporter permease subunit [Thermohalobaculum sp.]|nr:efflux RND transporter permease subunit [Thermohalobaculum sp.]
MIGIVDWAAARARMVLALIVVSVGAGLAAYVTLPKEGAPNIDVPVLYVSVPLPGVSARDAERLLVKPMEAELRGLDGLKEMTGIAAEGFSAMLLEFDFGWDKEATLAEVRDRLDRARAEFPADAEAPVIREINLSQFPVLVVSLSGEVPERTLLRLARDLRRAVEAIPAVLEAELTGHRDEMVEVLIDPLKLEAYGLTAAELLDVVSRNNALVAAGQLESETAAFSVTVPGAFESLADIYALPVKVRGDRVVRLGDIAEVRRTFEDAEGRARFNGEKTIALQVKKRTGENIIATVETVRGTIERVTAGWPAPLRQAVAVDFSMDESAKVRDMVGQLESSVLTAITLVMIVVLAALGLRSAVLVGLAIPASFLLSFGLMAALGMGINNMTMFGLILAVGMLVDGAIVVVEYADRRIREGTGPMTAYTEAARRMFWPIAASTATTLCAFLPMLLWPGMPGEFMGHLPITLIFVLSASLIVALVFLPVMGGVAGRLNRMLAGARAALTGGSAAPPAPAPYRRTAFGRLVGRVVLNPLGPFLALAAAVLAIGGIATFYMAHNNGVEFFVKTDPEQAIVFVRARGNLSLEQRDRLVRAAEQAIMQVEGVDAAFAFTGGEGLSSGRNQEGPPDAIGQVQVELAPWHARRPGDAILAEIDRRLAAIPGLRAEILRQQDGPQQGKPIQLEVRSDDWAALNAAAATARARFEATDGLVSIDDTRPLPGIDWRITVDRAVAGRFGADVAGIGPIVQAVTRGALLDIYRPDDSDEELEVRVRFPAESRLLATLGEMRVPTQMGLVPLSHFIDIEPAEKLAEITRRDGQRYFLVRADVAEGASDVEKIAALEGWIAAEDPFPATVEARFTGDREEQVSSQQFLVKAFAGALGLMFVILLAQFNSFYHTVLVLSAVVMSVAGVMIGMLVMGQKFSIIMTGTGIVALAGIVVNNNIVLIDTFQELVRRMDPLEAIIRTAEQRIRPVLLTTLTTMAGLAPMMFAASLDFASGGISLGAPTAIWWTQLATAVVFGLGFATVLTLVVTPSALAAQVWSARGALRLADGVGFALLRLVRGRAAAAAWLDDRRLQHALDRQPPEESWPETAAQRPRRFVRAAE